MRSVREIRAVLLAAVCCLLFASPLSAAPSHLAAEEPAAAQQAPALEGAESATRRNYSSLASVVAMIGSEAMAQLQDFFDLSPVTIEPFVVVGEFASREKVSLLAVTLTDQMAAEVGNGSLAVWRPSARGDQEQRVSGLLQEVDGYLRVHVTAVNTRGERRSCVVNVEMNEPIYRALHSYVTVP